MYRIFKPRYTVLNVQTGRRETRQSKKWYVQLPSEAPGKRGRAVPGYKDRRSTEQLALDLELRRDRERQGIYSPTDDQAARPLRDHLEEYADHLRHKGDGEKHVRLTTRRIQLLCVGAKFEKASDITQSGVLAYLAKCKSGKGPCQEGKQPNRMSRETANHYIRAARGFSKWLWTQKRYPSDPLAGLPISNPEVDRRHVRRVLSEADFGKLLQAIKHRPFVRCGMNGPDRQALYLLAAYTGLRCGELAALTVENLHLGKTPHVVVEALTAKSRRGAQIPIPPDVAERLRPWLKGRTGRVFPQGPWAHKAARMLRGDLKAAGISYRDEQGRVFDFHSLRSQYGTNLARAGVDLRVTQRLMRHSSPTLTAKYYTRLELEDLASEAAKLPPPPK